MLFKRLTLISALSALIVAAPGVLAQQSGQPAQADIQSNQAAQVDDATIEKFSEAMVEVQSIQAKFTEQLQNVEDNEEAQELQTQAQQEMIAAVEDKDFTVEEYNNLTNLIAQNPQLQQRVRQRLEDR